MNRAAIWVCTLALGALTGLELQAGSERVAWPEGYSSTFVRYHSVDKPKGQRAAKVRFFYVNASALAAAKAGQPLPEGTVLIMEDRKIVLDAKGEPKLDGNGRFIPTTEITNVFVQEKRAGWGEIHPEALRNGDWEYAWFLADGSRKPDAKYEGCFGCHKAMAAADYNFTFTPFLSSIKP
jgi:hypothetical protein